MENRITYPVSAANSIELPDWFRQKYRIKPGDAISLLETDAGLLVAPRTELAMQLLDRIGERIGLVGALAAGGRDREPDEPDEHGEEGQPGGAGAASSPEDRAQHGADDTRS